MVNFQTIVTKAKSGIRDIAHSDVVRKTKSELKSFLKPEELKCPKLKPLEQDVAEFAPSARAIIDNPKEYIKASEYLEVYTTPEYPYIDNWGKVNNALSPNYIEKTKFLESLSPEKILEYENVIKEVLEKRNVSVSDIIPKIRDNFHVPCEAYHEMQRVQNMLELYKADPEAYRYVLNSDYWFEGFGAIGGRGGGTIKGCCKNLSVDTLKELESIKVKPKVNCGDILEYYIIDSNKIYNGDLPQKLHEVIAQKVLSSDLTATRAERSVACFNEMNISPKLQKRLKTLNRLLKFRTNKATMFTYRKDYLSPVSEGQNMYDYIKNAETLTLADAMEMCHLVDKRTQDMILSELRGKTLDDSRFKSYSMADDFVCKWVKDGFFKRGNAKIVHKTNIKKGTEAIFIDDIDRPNGQYEVLVNNNPKQTTIDDVYFDRKNNVFYFDSTLADLAE